MAQWDSVEVSGAKQRSLVSVGLLSGSIWGSVGLSEGQWVSMGVIGAPWGSVEVSGAQWGVSWVQWESVGVNGAQWQSAEVSGVQRAMYIHPISFKINTCDSIEENVLNIVLALLCGIYLKNSLHTFNFCCNSNYRGIITDYECVSSTYNSSLFSLIFGLHLSIISL